MSTSSDSHQLWGHIDPFPMGLFFFFFICVFHQLFARFTLLKIVNDTSRGYRRTASNEVWNYVKHFHFMELNERVIIISLSRLFSSFYVSF